jgi:hypothetical protein
VLQWGRRGRSLQARDRRIAALGAEGWLGEILRVPRTPQRLGGKHHADNLALERQNVLDPDHQRIVALVLLEVDQETREARSRRTIMAPVRAAASMAMRRCVRRRSDGPR